MHSLTALTAAAAMAAGMHLATPDTREWRAQGDYDTVEQCQAAGFSGALFQMWDQWRCDADHVLWVNS
ncbi:hypothetical protein [Saccharothrix xinjiangensis]|uniref:Uncharacterized protein n=1 Tax=Saccharothrix xinjiangensis TaxID=204798 RepID=A0ABV9Y9T8_9PSEU